MKKGLPGTPSWLYAEQLHFQLFLYFGNEVSDVGCAQGTLS